ncbi:MAG: T9SS type A sorting domain-containing protein [Paludibacter sp.]|nr:T9SS type A sorting domain-containing protein [Paludibacter sp.]
MKHKSLIIIYLLFLAAGLFAQNTLFVEKQICCFNQSVEIRSEIGNIAEYTLNWQFKTSNTDWDVIQNMPCTVTPIEKTILLSAFINPSSFEIRCIYNNKTTFKDSISNTVSINILPDIVAPLISAISQPICYNTGPSAITITQQASGSDGNFTYQWQVSTDNTNFSNIQGATLQSYQPSSLIQTSYYRVRATSTYGCGTINSANTKVEVYTELKPSTIGNAQTICYNTTPLLLQQATLPTGGNGTYSYQWQTSTDDLTFSNISNQISIQYQAGNLTNSTIYRLQVTSSCGIVYTPSIKVTVLPNIVSPQISSISQPICYNTNPSLLSIISQATGGDGNFSYQWQQSINNTTFIDINGATSLTYQAGNLTQTTYYRVVATSTVGCGTLKSASSKVEVYAPLTVDNFANQTICYNTQPTILTTVPSGGGGSYIYQWQESTNGTIFSDISGANLITYQPTTLLADRYFRVYVVSQKGCTPSYSNAMKVTVFTELKPGSIGSAQTICYNTIPAVLQQSSLPTGGNGTYSYQWQTSTDDLTFSNISNQISIQYQAVNLTNSTIYRLQLTSSCGIVYTPSIKVTVLPNIVAPGISAITPPICYNTAPTVLSVTTPATGSDGVFTYQWQQSTNNISFTNINDETSLAYQAGSLIQTTYYRVVATSTFGCGSATSISSKVEVYTPLTVDNLANQTICYNTQPTIIIAVPHGGGDVYTYQWQESTNGTDFSDIASANNISYQPKILAADRHYRVLVVSQKGCSSVYSNSTKVTVYGELKPGTISGDQVLCYGESNQPFLTIIYPIGSNGLYTYQWQNSNDNLNWTDISGETSKDFSVRSMLTSKYYRLKTNSLCGSVYTNGIYVLVNLLPEAVTILGDTCVCSNQYADYSINRILNPSNTYEWFIEGGVILNNTTIDVNTISVKWDKTSLTNKLSILQTINSTGCKLNQDFVIRKLSSQSLDRTEIIRKSTSNILISTEKTPNTHYQWGYTSLSNNKSIFIDDSDRRFVQYPMGIDTTSNSYWVKASVFYQNKDTCTVISTYHETIRSQIQSDEIKFDLYPNPARNYFNITADLKDKTDINIKIISLDGTVLYKKTINEVYILNTQLELNLPRGIYLIHISNIDIQSTQKLIIE